MNFECPLENTDLLLTWLAYLRDKLHAVIPGSLLIWYDSVLHDGTLRWQSALSEKNYRFMDVTDGMFTDYHWQLENLEETMETYNHRIKM